MTSSDLPEPSSDDNFREQTHHRLPHQQSKHPAAATTPEAGDTVIASDVTPGSYRDTNSAGKRVEITTPYGGNSQSQANANEVKITQRLNQQQLQVPPTSP